MVRHIEYELNYSADWVCPVDADDVNFDNTMTEDEWKTELADYHSWNMFENGIPVSAIKIKRIYYIEE